MSPYGSKTAVELWEPTPEESDYLFGYAVPLIRRFFNHAGQLIDICPYHNKRWDWSREALHDKRLLKALLHPQVTCKIYRVGATFGVSKPTRVPLRPFGSNSEPVIEPKPPEQPWLSPVKAPDVPSYAAISSLANRNAVAILNRLRDGHMITLVRDHSVVVARYGPSNIPTSPQLVDALIEHWNAIAVERRTKTMREASCQGFVAFSQN
jgi:hypothetical protein